MNFNHILFANTEENSPLKILIHFDQKNSKQQYFDFLIDFLHLVLFDASIETKKSKPAFQEKILKKFVDKKITVPQLKKILFKYGGGREGGVEENGWRMEEKKGKKGEGGEGEGGGEGENGVSKKKDKKQKGGESKREKENRIKKEVKEGVEGIRVTIGGVEGEEKRREEGEEVGGLRIFWLRGKFEEFFGSIIDLKRIRKSIEREFREENVNVDELEKSN